MSSLMDYYKHDHVSFCDFLLSSVCVYIYIYIFFFFFSNGVGDIKDKKSREGCVVWRTRKWNEISAPVVL